MKPSNFTKHVIKIRKYYPFLEASNTFSYLISSYRVAVDFLASFSSPIMHKEMLNQANCNSYIPAPHWFSK